MSAFVFQWAMIPDSVPVAHQRCEAIADLMDHLRDLGLVLTGEPRAAIQHGRNPILTPTQRATLDHTRQEAPTA